MSAFLLRMQSIISKHGSSFRTTPLPFTADPRFILKRYAKDQLRKIAKLPCPVTANPNSETVAVAAAKAVRRELRIIQETACSRCEFKDSCSSKNKAAGPEPLDFWTVSDLLLSYQAKLGKQTEGKKQLQIASLQLNLIKVADNLRGILDNLTTGEYQQFEQNEKELLAVFQKMKSQQAARQTQQTQQGADNEQGNEGRKQKQGRSGAGKESYKSLREDKKTARGKGRRDDFQMDQKQEQYFKKQFNTIDRNDTREENPRRGRSQDFEQGGRQGQPRDDRRQKRQGRQDQWAGGARQGSRDDRRPQWQNRREQNYRADSNQWDGRKGKSADRSESWGKPKDNFRQEPDFRRQPRQQQFTQSRQQQFKPRGEFRQGRQQEFRQPRQARQTQFAQRSDQLRQPRQEFKQPQETRAPQQTRQQFKQPREQLREQPRQEPQPGQGEEPARKRILSRRKP